MTFSQRQIFLQALEALLRPVARFCIRRSLKVQDFGEIAKSAFLSAAAEEIEREGSAVSASRLSVITGLHRRDVMRLYANQESKLDANPGIAARVIGQWQQDARFSKAGKARPLRFDRKNSEFVELVRSVSKDLNPYTVLFELERIGAAKKTDDTVVLESTVYVPSGDLKGALSLLAADAADLLSAVEENIFRPAELPNLHIKTHYDNIAPQFLTEIRKWFLDKGQDFHDEARRFLSKFDKDLNPRLADRQGKARAVVGTFSLIETESPADDEEPGQS